MKAQIEIPIDSSSDFCRRNRIRRLALFGSVLREDFTPESDVDVLVEFEPDAKVGLAYISIQDEHVRYSEEKGGYAHIFRDREQPELVASRRNSRFSRGSV